MRRSRLVLALLASAAASPAFAQEAAVPSGAIEVTLVGVRPRDGGTLIVVLYDRSSGWLTLDSAVAVQRVPPVGDTVTVRFDAVPYDSGYAIAVIHDRNGNGKLDMRWFPFPKPKEGSGVSNNHVRAGKPSYDDARFSVDEALTEVRIAMRY